MQCTHSETLAGNREQALIRSSDAWTAHRSDHLWRGRACSPMLIAWRCVVDPCSRLFINTFDLRSRAPFVYQAKLMCYRIGSDVCVAAERGLVGLLGLKTAAQYLGEGDDLQEESLGPYRSKNTEALSVSVFANLLAI
ncbi:uncharacterized protein UDID_20447 [Ustilago sp. UG-2017a]|nr:uncharacterized protein UDID_20447 [Ustilago sp. UG-2017a]